MDVNGLTMCGLIKNSTLITREACFMFQTHFKEKTPFPPYEPGHDRRASQNAFLHSSKELGPIQSQGSGPGRNNDLGFDGAPACPVGRRTDSDGSHRAEEG